MEILSILVNICSISATLDTYTVEFEENNVILLRKVGFALMIPNPSLDCSYVVLNFWPNLSIVILIKKKRVSAMYLINQPLTWPEGKQHNNK